MSCTVKFRPQLVPATWISHPSHETAEVIKHRAKAGHLADLPPVCPESKRHEAALDKAFQLCLEDLHNSPRDEHNFIVLVLGSALLQPDWEMEELMERSISQVLVIVTGPEVEGTFSSLFLDGLDVQKFPLAD